MWDAADADCGIAQVNRTTRARAIGINFESTVLRYYYLYIFDSIFRTPLMHALRRGDGSHESWPAAKGFLSCIGTNIALKKAERPKAPLIVLYSVVNYRSTLAILRVL